MTPAEILLDIEQIHRAQEAAVVASPSSHAQTYRAAKTKLADLSLRRVNKLADKRYNSVHIELINRYLCVSAYISVFAAIEGNKNQSDKARRSCTQLINALGLNHKKVLAHYLWLEHFWQNALGQKTNKVMHTPYVLAVASVVIIIGISIYFTLVSP